MIKANDPLVAPSQEESNVVELLRVWQMQILQARKTYPIHVRQDEMLPFTDDDIEELRGAARALWAKYGILALPGCVLPPPEQLPAADRTQLREIAKRILAAKHVRVFSEREEKEAMKRAAASGWFVRSNPQGGWDISPF